MKKVGLSFCPLKISKLANGYGLKFLFFSGHYHLFCKVTMLNGWEKDQFTSSINLLILNYSIDM
jgi:hypothetical protein